MISLRKQRNNHRNSLLIGNNIASDALIQFVLNNGCFRNKDIGSLNTKDTFSIYNYFCTLLSYSVNQLSTDSSITVLIDAAKISVKALRLILKACQNVLAFRSKHVLILEPESFFDQQRLSLDILLENYDFKTTLCSKNKLWKYVNVADLADSFAPTFPNRWNDIRKGFEEHFQQNPSYITKSEPSHIPSLSRLVQKGSSILIELSAPILGKYSRVFEANDPLAMRMQDDEAIDEVIYDEAMAPSQAALPGCQTPEDTLDEAKNKNSTNEDVPITKEVPENVKELLEEQKGAINELLDWIIGYGEKWLNTLNEVGESIDEARQLEKQHHQLSTRTEHVVDQAAEISEVVDFLLREGQHSSACEPLKSLATELANAVYAFRQRVKKQAIIRTNSITFHETVTEFYNESDTLLKSLCNGPMEESSCQTEMVELDKIMGGVEARFETFTEICSVFEDLLSETGDNRKRDQEFIKEQLGLVMERRKRCHELLDLHKLKLQQMIQLQTCEKDQEQVVRWLEEIVKLLLKDSFRYGLSQTALTAKIAHFEKSAKSFQEYGKQLSQVSMLLRRSLRLEISPQLAICKKINSLWTEFEHNLTRHKSHIL